MASVPDKPEDKNPKQKPVEKLGLDLISLNIQRARDHGIPSYTTIKHMCYPNDPKITSFDDLKEDVPRSVKMLFIKKYIQFNIFIFYFYRKLIS